MSFHNNGDAFKRNLGGTASATPTGTTTTTSTSAPAATTSSSSGSTGFFSVNGSPPLIVAFLAVGVFMAALVAIFGWRRMTVGRGLIQVVPGGGRGHIPMFVSRNMRQEKEYGERPELWDLWTDHSEGGERVIGWEAMTPLSATIKRSGNTESPSKDNRPSNPSTRFLAASRWDMIQQHLRRPATREATTVAATPPEMKDNGESPRLQLALAIAMPSPRHRDGRPKGYPDEDEPLDYSVGLMELPWHSEKGL